MVPALIYPSAVSLRERDGARLGFVTTRHDRCTPPWLAVFHVAGANQPKRSSSSSFCLCRSISVPGLAFSFVVPCHSLASPSSSSPSSLFFITLSLSLSLTLSVVLKQAFRRGGGVLLLPVAAFLSRPCREKPLLPMPRMQKTSRKWPLIVPEWQSSTALPTTG